MYSTIIYITADILVLISRSDRSTSAKVIIKHQVAYFVLNTVYIHV